jgi:tellurite resistance protein TerC
LPVTPAILPTASESLNLDPWVWWVTIGVAAAVLAFDVVWIARNPHRPSNRETGLALVGYVGAAILFGLAMWYFAGAQLAGEFYAGWLTEYSLSVDNLFIFILIMAKFAVPEKLQQFALMVGIVIAIVLRGIFIAVGAAAINTFSWVFYIFGAFLVYTAVQLVRNNAHSHQDDYQENRMVRLVERWLPATSEYHGASLFIKEKGKRLITPMFIVIVTLGTTDLLFALDSIPAIYGLTNEAYLVLTANIFALMGLRQLYFLIGGLLKRLIYLTYGLAILLGFIGLKLILHAMHENELPFLNGGEPFDWAPDIPIWISLIVIVGTLAITAVASLAVSGRRPQPPAEGVVS